MKIILIVVFAIAALGGLIVLVGCLLPVNHTASQSAPFRASNEQVWDMISDFQNSTRWRSDLKSVQRLPDTNGRQVWREVSRDHTSIDYETVELELGKRIVRRISTKGLPFGGAWKIELGKNRESTLLTITEDGEVYNPVFRFVSRFVIGHTATIDRYLTQLKSALGEN